MLNKNHMRFINRRPIERFCKENNIKYSGVDLDGLVDKLNEELILNKVSTKKFEEKLYEWLLQGQKKCIFKYLLNKDLNKLSNYHVAKRMIDKDFKFSKDVSNIFDLSNNTQESINLIDVKYIYDKNYHNNKIIFFFTYLVYNITKKAGVESKTPIALPVHVIIDFNNSEIISRVSTKTNIYNTNGDFITDIFIGKAMLKFVANILNLNINTKEQLEYIKKTIFKVHEKLTELPQEIYDKIKLIDTKINNFIHESAKDIEINITPNNFPEIKNSLENILIKEVLKTYSNKDRSIFTKGKFGFSTSITAAGRSFSKIQHTSPKQCPIHLLPEYQNTRSILGETEEINKNIVYWVSKKKIDKFIRGKLYLDLDEFGIVSFEEYVLEEEINNVFFHIRNLKPQSWI